LHAVNHSLTKGMLFLVAGNTLAHFHSKSTRDVRGTLRVLPVTGLLWIAGLLAITGCPPFGTFLSEFAVLKGILDAGRWGIAVFYLAALGIVFAGMSAVILPLVYGKPDPDGTPPAEEAHAAGEPDEKPSERLVREPWWSLLPPVVLGLAVLILGVYLPPALSDLLHRAARVVGAE
jgi:hydrogenase-4 component F